MAKQFKNRKAVDPYGKDYSQIPDEIQWGDMMISKQVNPEAWEQYAAKIKAGVDAPQPYRNSMRQRTDRELIDRGLADNEAKYRYSYNSALQKKESNERLLRINTLEDARREFPNRPDDELQQILATTNKTRKYLEADAKKYAATGGGFPTYEEWKIQAEAGEKEHQRKMQAQPQPLRSVPAGTIREPLFGRNPDGSPKPRPPGITSEEIAALSAAQERQYNPPQKTTKKTSKSTSTKPASTPPGVIGYDALNQPVYGRTAPTQMPAPSAPQRLSGPGYEAKTNFEWKPSIQETTEIYKRANLGDARAKSQLERLKVENNPVIQAANRGDINARNAIQNTDRQYLKPLSVTNPGQYSEEPVRSAGLPESIKRELEIRAARGDSNATRNLANIKKAEQLGSIPKTEAILPAGSVFSGSYDRNGDPIYGVPVPGMKVNLPKGGPLPKDQVLAMRQKAIDADKQRQADWSTGGRPSKEALLAKQGITGNNQALAVWDGSYDSNGDPRYGIPVPGMKANVPKGQPLNREQAKAQQAAVMQRGSNPSVPAWADNYQDKWAAIQNKQRTDTPASTIAPYRDMQGNPVKLDDLYTSGGLGKSAESKKQSEAAKRKASQPASTKGTGQAGGSFRVINGQVRFFGSGADAAKEVDPVKPTGMR